jgi:predicted acyl esterase
LRREVAKEAARPEVKETVYGSKRLRKNTLRGMSAGMSLVRQFWFSSDVLAAIRDGVTLRASVYRPSGAGIRRALRDL